MALHPVHGHDAVRKALTGAVRSGTLPGTILLHGDRGVGKQRLALWLAQMLLCDAPLAERACGSCRSCRLASKIEHPDLHWYFPVARPSGARTPDKLADALEEVRAATLAEIRSRPLRSSYGDDARGIYLAAARQLRKSALSRPSMGSAQVFIVADAENLVPQESSPEAANALLKLLEEPSPGTTLVLTSSEPGGLLPTIRSRSLSVRVPPLEPGEVERFLVEVGGQPPDLAGRAARLSGGSIGRALAFLPDDEGEPGPLERLRQESLLLLRAGLAPRPGSAFRTALDFKPWGARGLQDLLGSLEEWLRDLAAVAAGSEGRLLNADHAEELRRWAGSPGLEPLGIVRAREAVEEARLQARGNVNPQLLVTGLVTALRRCLRPAPAEPRAAGAPR